MKIIKYLKLILLFILLFTSIFSSFGVVKVNNSLRQNYFCGDGSCNIGENNLNCYADCSIKTITGISNYDDNLNPINLYSDFNNEILIMVKNNKNYNINFSLKYDNILYYFTNKLNLTYFYKLKPKEQIKIKIPLKINFNKLSKEEVFNQLFYFNIILNLNNGKVLNFPYKLKTYPNYDLSKIKFSFLDTTVPDFNKLILVADFTNFIKTNKIKNLSLEINLLNNKNKSINLGLYKVNILKNINLIYFSKFNNSNLTKLSKGFYTLNIKYNFNNNNNNNLNSNFKFEFFPIFWSYDRLFMLFFILIFLFFIFSFLYSYVKYHYYKLSKARYITPSLKNIPKPGPRSILIGKLGGLDKKAYISVDDLLTHALVAGSTGSGKSVTSSVFVEGVLDKNIPVVVFDPTAQWTGFLASNKDDNVLKHFKDFNMTENDSKSYKGIIYEVKGSKIDLDFKDYMNPGEITVFNLSDLKPGDYGLAVRNIVQTIFKMGFEESPQLKMLLVFDEVHRLLSPTEDKSGYESLEKAAREFRKWGIGVLMVSQVSSDFKEALQGNVLTEVQLNTKSMSDINKVKTKYGELYSGRITRMNIGTGLIQNPHYNDGHPWFVNIKPPVHSPHKLSDDLLLKYTQYSSFLKKIDLYLKKEESLKIDTTDIRMDLKLAKNKLKEGRFKMVEIYVESLTSYIKSKKNRGLK